MSDARWIRSFMLACGIATWVACLAGSGVDESAPIDPSEVSSRQRAMVDSIGEILAEVMAERGAEEALLIDLASLYAPLDADQRAFLDAIRAMEGGDPELGVAARADLIAIAPTRLETPEGEREIPLRLLSRDADAAWSELDAAMREDIGRGLVIGSGYRSPANQLSLFVRFMPLYDYSPARTLPHVSLPGASDHNRIDRLGLDFVTEDGVDLRYSDPAAFRARAEYRWLVDHADRFGFAGEGADSASPWHWHYAGGRDESFTWAAASARFERRRDPE